jgi:glycosyltransferase involved in cell wall biosynthesis
MNHMASQNKSSHNNRTKNEFAIVIPVYNHHQKIAAVIESALTLNRPIFVVNDGSSDATHERIKKMSGIHIIRHKKNLGKGAALMTGFAAASKTADWAIALDADGQHDPGDANHLINAARHSPNAIIIGRRTGMEGANVHWTSRFGRQFSNFWVWISGGPMLTDSQSGFRAYPLPASMNLNVKSQRFEFEVEILVRARRKGISIIEVPVSVRYDPPGERISHFRPWLDFFRNTRTFAGLIVERVLVNPFFNR